MYAIIQNNTITQYPANPRADHPDTSFGDGWRGGIVNGTEYVWVEGTTQPTYDQKTQRVVEGTPTLTNGTWSQTWMVEALSADEQAAQLAAWRRTMTVSRLQAKIALQQAGHLAAAEAAVAASSDPIVALAWAEAQEFDRLSPLLTMLAAQMGLSDMDVDALFVAAAAVRV